MTRRITASPLETCLTKGRQRAIVALMEPKRVKITLSPAQFDALTAAATELGLPLPDHLRMRALEPRGQAVIVPPPDPWDRFDRENGLKR